MSDSNCCICNPKTLIFLILVLLQFGRRCPRPRRDIEVEQAPGFERCENRPVVDNSILFIIVLFYLCCCKC